MDVLSFLIPSAFVGQGLGYSKLYLAHLVLIICTLVAFKRNIKFLASKEKIVYPLITIWFYSVISLTWSPNARQGIVENIQMLIGLMIVLISIVVSKKHTLNRFINIILWTNLFISLSEGFEIFRYPYSQYSAYAPILKRNNYDWAAFNIDWPTGFHWNPNNNAFFILFTFPLFLKNTDTLKGWLYYCISTLVIYLSASKLILLGWVLMTLLLTIYLLRKKFKIMIFLCLVFFVALTALIFQPKHNVGSLRLEKYSKIVFNLETIYRVVPKIVISRMNGNDISFNLWKFDRSLNERLIYVDGLFKSIHDNFLFGVGAGGLKDKYHEQDGIKVNLTTPHFYFLEIWAKFGFFIFFLFMCWIFYLLVFFWRIDKKNFLSLLLFSLFNPVMSSCSYFLPMWGFFGIILKDYIEYKYVPRVKVQE